MVKSFETVLKAQLILYADLNNRDLSNMVLRS